MASTHAGFETRLSQSAQAGIWSALGAIYPPTFATSGGPEVHFPLVEAKHSRKWRITTDLCGKLARKRGILAAEGARRGQLPPAECASCSTCCRSDRARRPSGPEPS